MTQAEAPAKAVRPVLRGSVDRATDLMEAYQAGYLRAIAAAAGCVPSRAEIDEGVDITLTHRSPEHTVGDKVARVEVQMKATSTPVTSGGTHVSTRMTQKRHDEFGVPNPTIDKIVVILSMPADPKDWVVSESKFLRLHHCAYWVNLAGSAKATAANPTVKAPIGQVFDDLALCKIMERIGKGEAP